MNFLNMDSPVMRFLSRVCDLMILNVLCMLCCLPIITAGASVTALYSVTLKMVKDEESYIVKGFFKAFKENFKQSTIIWIIMAAVGALLYADYRAVGFLSENMQNIFRILIGAVVVIFLIILSYVFSYTARFVNSTKNIFKNSLLIGILNLPWTVLLVVYPALLILATFISTTTVVYGSMLWFVIGFALIAYINSYIFRKIFAKYEPSDEEPTDASELPDETEN